MKSFDEAALKGDLEKVKTLLKADADLVFSEDEWGHTPLHWAAIRGHKDVAEFLLANRAQVNARTKVGDTPLRWAIHKKNGDPAELLRRHGGCE